MGLLSMREVRLRFGGIVALDDVSLEVDEGRIVGLIGPNGAGKTTAFNVITRLYRPDEGEVEFDGRSLLRTPPYRIVKHGIARTFQNVEVFPTMTVLENVLVGAHANSRFEPEHRVRTRAEETLELVGLRALAGRPAAGLPFGTLKRVELALVGLVEPRDDVERGRLAGAVRPDQADDAALLDIERQVVERDDAREAKADVPQ